MAKLPVRKVPGIGKVKRIERKKNKKKKRKRIIKEETTMSFNLILLTGNGEITGSYWNQKVQ